MSKPAEETRVPLHNVDAEQGVLGVCLTDEQALAELVRRKVLAPEAFFVVAHQEIFQAMVDLCQEGKPADEIAVAEVLRAREQLERAGGVVYLGELTARVEVSAHLFHWAELVRKVWVQRQVGALGQLLVEKSRGSYESAEAMLAAVSPLAGQVVNLGRKEEGGEKLAPTVEVLQQQAAEWAAGKKHVIPKSELITWGLGRLDEMWTPLHAPSGDYFITVNGFSSHGKSAFARHMMERNLVNGKYCLGMLLETTTRAFILRWAGKMAKFDVGVFRRGLSLVDLQEEIARTHPGIEQRQRQEELMHNFHCYQAWLGYAREVADKRLRLYENLYDLEKICAEVLAVYDEQPLDLVLVDYLQLVDKKDRGTKRGDEKLKDIAGRFKELGKQVKAPIICISALSGEGEDGCVTPKFTKARGSADIGYAGDRAIIAFRPARDDDGNDQEERRKKPGGTVELKLKQDKSRDLPIWEEKVLFTGLWTEFKEVPKEGHRGRPLGVKNGEGRERRGILPPGWTWEDAAAVGK